MIKPIVSVVIPVYNKADTVARTIDSVLNQTVTNLEVIIINDGSQDDSEDVIVEAIHHDERCRYIYQDNQGVAHTRNSGVFNYSRGQYILCLDSDDAIEPMYLEALLEPMENDRMISIAYTGLKWIKPDGSSGVSPWPDEFDAVAQMKGRNQIPTAALVRREVWDRLGGQRQRYAPLGAGAEDGDFWLRATSYGFLAQFVPAPSNGWFVYSWMSGLVTGNKSYQEVDYRAWSPWTKDKQLNPAPSLDKPHKFSHPVHQYDEPTVSIIIPVGPGHVKYLTNTLDSLDAQTYKKWEAIVVFDVPGDEWVELHKSGSIRHLAKTWPFCRFASTTGSGASVRSVVDMLDVYEAEELEGDIYHLLAMVPSSKSYGAGKARNVGIKLARAGLLLFLDADDWLVPEALRKMVSAYKVSQKAIFTDHLAIAEIAEEDLGRVDGKVVSYNHTTGEAYIHQRIAEYDCRKAMEQPYMDGRPPYVICNVTTLVPKRWVLDAGGFDENMSSWEDVLMFWRIAWTGSRCFEGVHEPLLVYRYGTGERRDHGFRERKDLLEYLEKESRGAKKMGCNCPGSKQANKSMEVMESMATSEGSKDMVQMQLSRGGSIQVQDNDLVMVRFESPQRGDQARFGMHDFDGGYIKYGWRSGNGTEEFLVHVLDIEADQSLARSQGRAPMFTPVAEVLIVPDEVDEPEELPPPDLVEEEDVRENPYIPTGYEEQVVDAYVPVEGEAPKTPSEEIEIKDAVASGDILLIDLDMGGAHMLKYIATLKLENIHTAVDVIAYERKYPDEGGISRIHGIGSRTRKIIVAASKKAVLGYE